MTYSREIWTFGAALFAVVMLIGMAPGCQSTDEDDGGAVSVSPDGGEPGADAGVDDATDDPDTSGSTSDDSGRADAADVGDDLGDTTDVETDTTPEPVAEPSPCSSTSGTVVINGTFEVLGGSQGFDPAGMRISEHSVIEWRYNDENGGEHVIASGLPDDEDAGELFEGSLASFQHDHCVEFNEVPESAGDTIDVHFHCTEHPSNTGVVQIDKNF